MKKYYIAKTQQILLLSIVSALLLGVPFLKYEYGFVAIFGAIAYLGLLYVLSGQKHYSLKKKILLAWLPGFLSLLIVVSWLPMASTSQLGTLPIYWHWALLIFTFLGFAAILSTQYLLIGLLTFGLKIDFKKPIIFLLLPSFWVVGEFCRSILFSVLLMGPGGTIGPFWNFGALGFAISTTPLGYASRFIGLWGLTFIAIIIGLSILWLIWRKWRLPVSITIGICTFAALAWLVWLPSAEKVRVGFLQYFIPPTIQVDKQEWVKVVTGLSEGAKQSDLLVMPEYSGVLDQKYIPSGESQILLSKFIHEQGAAVTSEDLGGDGKKVNLLVSADKNGQVLDTHQKTFLIPTGEYVPYMFEFILRAIHQNEALKHQQRAYTVQKGSQPDRPLDANGLKIAAQVCSGAIAPDLFRQQVKQGAQIMTNSAAIAVLAKSIPYHEQAKQTAHFMATANARPYVQGSFGTYSYIIDSDGRFLKQNEYFNFDYETDLVTMGGKRTIYTILGEWVVLLSLGATIGYAAYWFKHKKFDN